MKVLGDIAMLRTILPQHKIPGRLVKLLAHGACLGMAAVSGVALAEIAQTPLFLPVPPPPNLMYMLDNSGSMVWGTVTGTDATSEFNGQKTQRAYYSSAYNQIYYNPATSYTPAVTSTGASMGAASTGATLIDPYRSTSTLQTDLSTTCYARSPADLPLYNPSNFAAYNNCLAQSNGKKYQNPVAQYAFYYNWIGSGTPTGNINEDIDTNYKRVDILPVTTKYPRAATRTDCVADTTKTSCTYAEEIQNFANWFSYYRTRILLTKTSLGLAFSGVNDRFRVGFATINDNNGNTNTSAANFIPIATFDANQKKKWYDQLYSIKPGGGTPLIAALDNVGRYYQGKGMFKAATVDDPIQLSCQANHTILSTDGFWNMTQPTSIGDQDGTVPTLPAAVNSDPVSGTALTAGSNWPAPFYEGASANSNTLADTSMKYWVTDVGIRTAKGITGTAGKIKAPPTDPATWQHMTTHTIGLGANGTLAYQADYKTATTGDYADIKNGKADWPTPVADDPTAIDDLWHTAVNGHGNYFSARNPQALQAGINVILKEIGVQPGAASSIAYPGGYSTGSVYAYIPGFDSGSWDGHLRAKTINADGTFGSEKWDAATLLPAPADRNIVTWNPSTSAAVAFSWANLTSGSGSQQAALGSSDVLDYLRGSSAKEQAGDGSGGVYRYRKYKLGDIVNSSPLFVQISDAGYMGLFKATDGSDTYAAFLTAKAARSGMVYVGANDGMMHAFDASTGVEKFAFIPNSVYSNLKSLSDPVYAHHYSVDGPMAEGDAYIGAKWKNILLGTTGAGAQSVFAVDVTTPASLGASSVLWENSASGDNDLGNVLGAPAVVQLANGKWAAIFGNGYNSANQHAVLYLVDVSTGALIQKVDTGVGSATLSNGLSAPALIFNDQRQVIAAYAGDLQGNLWKFDLSNATDSSKWSSRSLFVAKNADNPSVIQPIVQKPQVAPHPRGGYIVMAGTGKYIETGDKANIDTQSVYGIWDDPTKTTAVTGRNQLQQQTFTSTTDGRKLSANPINWASQRGWYFDLTNSGERITGDLQILKDVVLLGSTLAPKTSDSCAGGIDSQFVAADFLTGAYTSKFHFIVAGKSVDASSVPIAGTAGTATPITPPGSNKPACLAYVDADGVERCQKFTLAGTAVRHWRQLSLKPN
ncbi:pilus assembly protein [Paraherbaspirillum soli]|uniref:Pilus assembly protein n=1 Tax=Paraherbaspirillum soli TaxID=631222 RepID=A0ABW0M5N1_9BURK